MVSQYELRLMFQKLIRTLEAVERKMEMLPELVSAQLMAKLRGLSLKVTDPAVATVTLNVAESKTLEALRGLSGERVTADDVAVVTGRARAVESMYLNGLARRGLVARERRGRRVFFILREGSTIDPG